MFPESEPRETLRFEGTNLLFPEGPVLTKFVSQVCLVVTGPSNFVVVCDVPKESRLYLWRVSKTVVLCHRTI